ncbi:MAG: NAD kinase [Rhodomicrobium sp.]|nr:MAG: NAD kinase [Rhodomicrobium sp.]
MSNKRFKKIAFVSGDTPEARATVKTLRDRYEDVPLNEADVLVALGGDGIMLQTLHSTISRPIPIYGMNFGSIGFLMNEYHDGDLIERLEQAEENIIHPLKLEAYNGQDEHWCALAINEVSLFRRSHQAAKLKISVDGRTRISELICDGVMVATPAGSTAYNLSAHGPILPVGAQLLALTPISPFRPRRWRGALLSNRATVEVEILEHEKRPVNTVADHREFEDVRKVIISEQSDISLRLLFDEGHALDERIINEQFNYS